MHGSRNAAVVGKLIAGMRLLDADGAVDAGGAYATAGCGAGIGSCSSHLWPRTSARRHRCARQRLPYHPSSAGNSSKGHHHDLED